MLVELLLRGREVALVLPWRRRSTRKPWPITQSRLLTALREVEDALSDVQERQLQAAAQAKAGSAANRAFLVAQARYDRGVSNYLDVTDAQRSALTADRAAAQIATQRLLASVAVARSLGAGWKQAAPLATIAQAPQESAAKR